MSWKTLPNGSDVDIVGPVGDTLSVHITSTSADYNWSGWTWTGQVRATPTAASTVGTFSIADTSTATALNLVASVSAATTAGWTPGDTLVWALRGTKSGTVVTFVGGKVIPKASTVQ